MQSESRADESVSTQVVYQVAAHEGADPCSLEPLYSVVDPEALDDLCDAHRETGTFSRITFEYLEYEVEIVVDGGSVHTSVTEPAVAEE